jgi:hypothetical protein
MNIKAKTDQREPKARSMIVKRRRCVKFSFTPSPAAKPPRAAGVKSENFYENRARVNQAFLQATYNIARARVKRRSCKNFSLTLSPF